MGGSKEADKAIVAIEAGKHYTAHDFNQLPAGPPYFELINNRLVMAPSPEIPHQFASISLASRLFLFVEEKKLGLVLEAPLDVELDEDNVFQPDIMFISNERLSIIKKGRKIQGAPDLVVEILSTNKKYDQKEKKEVYERHEVREFWLVDVKKRQVEVFQNERKAFVLLQKACEGDIVRSGILPGFELAVDYLFRDMR